MTSIEFVLWLKGFSEGVHEYNITPKQWDILKDKLAEVEDKTLILESPKFPFGIPNTAPIQTLPFIQPYPTDPYRVYCGSTLTTSSGSGATYKYDPSTTTTGYMSGSAWSYTNNTYNPPYTTGGHDEVIKHHNED